MQKREKDREMETHRHMHTLTHTLREKEGKRNSRKQGTANEQL